MLLTHTHTPTRTHNTAQRSTTQRNYFDYFWGYEIQRMGSQTKEGLQLVGSLLFFLIPLNHRVFFLQLASGVAWMLLGPAQRGPPEAYPRHLHLARGNHETRRDPIVRFGTAPRWGCFPCRVLACWLVLFVSLCRGFGVGCDVGACSLFKGWGAGFAYGGIPCAGTALVWFAKHPSRRAGRFHQRCCATLLAVFQCSFGP